jgi:universal stress protein A
MFRKILLPIDLEPKHQAAVQAAIQIARQADAEIVVLHVIETIEGLEEDQDFYDQLETASRERLKEFTDELGRSGVRSRWEIAFGSDSAEILRYASENQIDLIILTSPRFDPENVKLLTGSLSWKIGLVSPCPVLLMK